MRDRAGYSLTIAPGAVFPDRGFLTSARTNEVFDALLDEQRMRARWDGIGAAERRLHLTILAWFADHGAAPSMQDLADQSHLPIKEISRGLDALRDRDLVALVGEHIDVAYPFTTRATAHSVEANGVVNKAVCAIDALGVGAMLGTRTRIQSSCHHCHRAITVFVSDHGEIKDHVPTSTTVWASVTSIDSCAADTQCSEMIFFCSVDHLDLWLASRSIPVGYRLTLAEAAGIGAAIFKPFFRRMEKRA